MEQRPPLHEVIDAAMAVREFIELIEELGAIEEAKDTDDHGMEISSNFDVTVPGGEPKLIENIWVYKVKDGDILVHSFCLTFIFGQSAHFTYNLDPNNKLDLVGNISVGGDRESSETPFTDMERLIELIKEYRSQGRLVPMPR